MGRGNTTGGQSPKHSSQAAPVQQSASPNPREFLELKVHGRVLEHLGIQMYESPVNSLAELVANAWDADADTVSIVLPDNLETGADIKVVDNGIGMAPEECQERYLYVGLNRRGSDPEARSEQKHRHVLGRKGIGKFAGFGIARVMRINTVSSRTGERTVFELRLDSLMGQEYIGPGSRLIKVVQYEPHDETRKASHGTTITLYELKLSRTIRSDFSRSMARRFLLLQRQAGFAVTVNGAPLPDAIDLEKAQYVFPRDYCTDDRPRDLLLDGKSEDGWGYEKVGSHTVRWRFILHKDTVAEEEMRGITIYANGKLVQGPFLFHLTGGLTGQHGVEYLTGQVEADYLDRTNDDLVTTERQRINWESPIAEPLLKWGRQKTKEILTIWSRMRGESRRQQIESKVATFAHRLEQLPESERKTIRQALNKLGGIPTLSDDQFTTLGSAILTAWEQGRLHVLINEIAGSPALSEKRLLDLFAEMDVLTALNVAEAVKTRLMAVGELQHRINVKQLENPIRDYIAQHPYLLAPEYETFRVERGLKKFLDEMNTTGKMPQGSERKRVDLLLASGNQLVLFEFMKPGLTLDWEHLQRYELYFRAIRKNMMANSGGQFTSFTGFVVADSIEDNAIVLEKVGALRADNMFAIDWKALVHKAFKQHEEHFEALAARNPDDDRIKALRALRE